MDNTTYQLLLAPDLEISPEDFMAAWNEAEETSSVAEARVVERQKGREYDVSLLAGALITITTGVTSSVLSEMAKAVVLNLLTKKGQAEHVHKRLHIEVGRRSDGSSLLLIDKEEEQS